MLGRGALKPLLRKLAPSPPALRIAGAEGAEGRLKLDPLEAEPEKLPERTFGVGLEKLGELRTGAAGAR